jgi:hypothetical protein
VGLWKKVKKAAKKVGGAVKKATAVGLAAGGNPLTTKVAMKVAKSQGKYRSKSTVKVVGQVAKTTSKVAQLGGTAVATVFGGPMAGAAAYRLGALNKQYVDREVAKAKGTKVRKIAWKKQAIRGAYTVAGGAAAGLGASLLGGTGAGGMFGSGMTLAKNIFGGGSPLGGASASEQKSIDDMVAMETGGPGPEGDPGAAAGGGSNLLTMLGAAATNAMSGGEADGITGIQKALGQEAGGLLDSAGLGGLGDALGLGGAPEEVPEAGGLPPWIFAAAAVAVLLFIPG